MIFVKVFFLMEIKIIPPKYNETYDRTTYHQIRMELVCCFFCG